MNTVMNVEEGDEIEVEPYKYGKEGDAIASYNDHYVMVRGGKPGETYKLEIDHINQGIIFTELVPTAPRTGDIVEDTEDSDRKEYVVIHRTSMRVKDWEKTDGTTIADHNPDYHEESKNIAVVRTDFMEEQLPEWKEMKLSDIYPEVLEKDGLNWVNFPENRLKVVQKREEVMK